MTGTLRLGIAGLGTVGQGVVHFLQANAELIAKRCGKHLEITAVSARDRAKKRDINVAAIRWTEDPQSLALDPAIDVVVELIGGAEGVAKTLCTTALQQGKSVVTANKALIAHHGIALAHIAEAHKVALAFEAAVAGGIPIIKTLREGLAANHFRRIVGILNGTCNYILTNMAASKRNFAEVLAEAQALGFAEADPSFDIDGIDTAHKIAILASLAYGCPVDIHALYAEGIRFITAADIQYAAELGFRIKLLGIANLTPKGVEVRVHPAMVPMQSPLGSVDGVYNAILAEGDAVGTIMFEGKGAGAGPTASSVIADIMDIARGVRTPPFTLAVDALTPLPMVPMAQLESAYYIRLSVLDQPGVLAEVTAVFRDENLSVETILQRVHYPDVPVLILVVHKTCEANMIAALKKLATLAIVVAAPLMIRIESV